MTMNLPITDNIIIKTEQSLYNSGGVFNQINFSIYQENDDKHKYIGFAEIYLSYHSIDTFDIDFRDSYNDLALEFDELFSGGYHIYQSIFKSGINKKLECYLGKDLQIPPLFILNDLCLNEDVQNKGVGTLVLDYLENLYGYGRLKFLYAAPLDSNGENYEGVDYEDRCKRLVKFYRKNGYKILDKGFKTEHRVLYKAPLVKDMLLVS